MKNFIHKTLILLAVTLVFGACTKDDNFTIADPSAKIEVIASKTSIELSKDFIGQDALTISWTEADYNFASENPTYEVYFAMNETTRLLTTTTGEFTKTFEVEEFNKALLAVGFEPNTESELIITVVSKIGALKTTSKGILVNVTPYADKLDLSTAWGIVGSATPNKWNGPDVPFYKTSEATIYVAYATLATGEFKIRKDNNWLVAYGDVDNNGVLDQEDDNNISIEAGTYKITFNSTELTYKIEEYTWGIVGSGYNDWGNAGPDAKLIYDSSTDTWKALVTLLDGEIKFRLNNSWSTTNYGDQKSDLDGVLDQETDNNIISTAGVYLVTVDFNSLEYSIEATDIWGIVGSGYNDWGNDGPDAKFNIDFSKGANIWYIKNVTLLDGEIKFRLNDSWDTTNYGDQKSDLDGILDQEQDNNIEVTAGNYDIILDFSDTEAPTYKITKL